jgi:hypothetical protein
MGEPASRPPEPARDDETSPRDSDPALPDYQGDDDPDGEALLRRLAPDDGGRT